MNFKFFCSNQCRQETVQLHDSCFVIMSDQRFDFQVFQIPIFLYVTYKILLLLFCFVSRGVKLTLVQLNLQWPWSIHQMWSHHGRILIGWAIQHFATGCSCTLQWWAFLNLLMNRTWTRQWCKRSHRLKLLHNTQSLKMLKSRVKTIFLPISIRTKWIVRYLIPLIRFIIKNFSFDIWWLVWSCDKWLPLIQTQNIHTSMWIIGRRLRFKIISIKPKMTKSRFNNVIG